MHDWIFALCLITLTFAGIGSFLLDTERKWLCYSTWITTGLCMLALVILVAIDEANTGEEVDCFAKLTLHLLVAAILVCGIWFPIKWRFCPDEEFVPYKSKKRN